MNNENAVYIGRFQPFHLGHVHVIMEALEYAEHLIILIGSSNESRTPKNPFTVGERHEVIHSWATSEGLLANITILSLEDKQTDAEWTDDVVSRVRSFTNNSSDVSIIGHDKDDSSWYLNAFPQYDVKLVSNYEGLNATHLRNSLFIDNNPVASISESVPSVTKDFLVNFKCFQSATFRKLSNSSKVKMIVPELKLESKTEYPRIDHTADCIVLGTYEDYDTPYILLIKRKNDPGKGEWALPGGFVEVSETILDSAYRELEEETGIKRADLILEDWPDAYTFDDPNRDPRGRIVTTAYILECDKYIDSVNYEAKDDASDIGWFPLSNITLSNIPMFLDHKEIVIYCLTDRNIYTIA